MTDQSPARTRNAAATRQRILDAALVEFSAHGPAGARVERIVERAGVNPRMLYHYFGSKDRLFTALLESKLGQENAARATAPASIGDVLAQWQASQSGDTDWARLTMWEALARGNEPVVSEDARAAGWQGLVARIEQAVAEGHLPSWVDAAQLQLSLVALVTFPVAFPQFTRMITGYTPQDPEFVERRSEFLRHLGQLIESSASRPQ